MIIRISVILCFSILVKADFEERVTDPGILEDASLDTVCTYYLTYILLLSSFWDRYIIISQVYSIGLAWPNLT